MTSHFNDIVFKPSNSDGNDSTWFIVILIAGCQLHVYRGSSWTFVFSPYTMWPPSIIKYTPSPQKKNNKKLPRISEFVNLLSIDWSFSTVALRVVRRQQFMTILSASAAQHALLCCIWMNWTTNLTNFYMNYRCLSGQKQRLVTYATDIWRTFHYCPNSRQR